VKGGESRRRTPEKQRYYSFANYYKSIWKKKERTATFPEISLRVVALSYLKCSGAESTYEKKKEGEKCSDHREEDIYAIKAFDFSEKWSEPGNQPKTTTWGGKRRVW